MSTVDLKVYDNLTPELKKLLKRSTDLSPVMKKTESIIMKRERWRGWMRSGLHRRSGELFGADKTWHGKRSAGVSIKARKGATDDYMKVIKASVHTKGRKKGAGDKHGRNRRYWVRAHVRKGRKIRRHLRYMPTPWGDIPARPFLPDSVSTRDAARIKKWITGYLAKRRTTHA